MYEVHQRSPVTASTVEYGRSDTFMSSTPILQPQQPSVYQRPAKQHVSAGGLLDQASQLFQQIPRPGVTLPAIGCFLFFLNHLGALIRLVFRLGFLDCVAIACILVGAAIATQHLRAYLRKAAQSAVSQLLQLADSKVMLDKLTEVANSNPAPGKWLEMYVTMVGDIAGIHHENIKMRAIMAGMQADIDHLKAKGKYIHPVRTMYRAVSGHNKNQAAIPE